MAVLVSGNISVGVDITDARSAVAGAAKGTGSRKLFGSLAWQIASGIAAGQGDKVWADSRTITTGATDSLDLATGGNLTDEFGAAVVLAKLRAIVLFANGIAGVPNTTTLQLARPAANGVPLYAAISDALAPVSAGGIIVWADPAAGVVPVAATADLISIINSAGASAGCDIYLVGTSA